MEKSSRLELDAYWKLHKHSRVKLRLMGQTITNHIKFEAVKHSSCGFAPTVLPFLWTEEFYGLCG